MTAYVNEEDDPVECELKYDDTKSVATSTSFQKYSSSKAAWEDVNETINATAADKNLYINSTAGEADNDYSIGIKGQYGDYIVAAEFAAVSDGTVVPAGTTKFDSSLSNKKFRLSYGDKSQVITVTTPANTTFAYLFGTWAKSTVSNVATTAAELETILANTQGNNQSDEIVIGATFASAYNLREVGVSKLGIPL